MQGIRCGRRSQHAAAEVLLLAPELRTESVVGVEDALRTGFSTVVTSTSRLRNSIRFAPADLQQVLPKRNVRTYRDRHRTGPECNDAFVKGDNVTSVPLRAVVCVRAMRKFEGLYDFSLMAATVDDSRSGLHTRMDAAGVTLENGQRITKAFLDAIGRRP